MRILAATIAFTATAAATTAAFADATRLTDADFVKASRCRGLIGSQALGALDTSALDSLLRSQQHARPPVIMDRASVARSEAERDARRAKEERKAKLLAERDGVCRTFVG